MTYDELVQKIRDYTEVDANVLTSTIVNGFIENAPNGTKNGTSKQGFLDGS